MHVYFKKLSFSLALVLLAIAQGAFGAEPESEPAKEAVPSVEPAAPVPQLENSVVHVFSTARNPDLMKPWAKSSPAEKSGSGVVIEGNRILTNAHVVLFASQIQVQGNQSGDKLSATLEYINPYIDLALLKLDDESFFKTRPPVVRSGGLPSLKEAVMAYGYPTGGDNLSITKGIVSRIEFTGYNYPVSGIRIQIDAAINPGNSGGPAISGDRMIGLAFSHLGNAQNIGYIIPNEEVELFLKDIADGKVDGKPGFYESWQTNENTALRSYLKLPEGAEGVLITQIDSQDPAFPLKPWDLVTQIGAVKIDNQGMIKLAGGLTVSFRYEVQHAAREGMVPLTVLREGKPLEVLVPAPNSRPSLIPNRMGEYPRYFIIGPLVFGAADRYSSAWTTGSSHISQGLAFVGHPMLTRLGDQPAFPGEELVYITSPFFPHKLSKGYGNPFGRVVEKLNGTPVKNLRHLVELLRDATEEYLVFEFSGRVGETLVFRRTDLLSSTESILSDNGVRSQGSPGLMEVWAKVGK